MLHWWAIRSLMVTACCFLTAVCEGNDGDPPAPQIETVLIKGATFTMGTPLQKKDPQYHADEAPLTVTVSDFRIGKYPVTAEQMCAFLNCPEAKRHDRQTLYICDDIGEYRYSTIVLTDDEGYVPREGAAAAPANQVTWTGAVLFCEWLSEKTGRKYRLPTEAEWELAARGKEGRSWPWGGEAPGPRHGLRYQKYPSHLTWPKTPVGSHLANATPDGVHDMLAYVTGEWCVNKYVGRPSPEQANDRQVDLDNLMARRVVRGCYDRAYRLQGFFLVPEHAYASHLGRPWTRVGFRPINANNEAALHGFRVVEEITQSNEVNAPTIKKHHEGRWEALLLIIPAMAPLAWLLIRPWLRARRSDR